MGIQWWVLNCFFLFLSNYRSSTDWGSEWGRNSLHLLTLISQSLASWVQANTCLLTFLQAPCRKLLTTLIKGLDAHLFDSHHDIYMPNCDKRGFFRKKQVSLETRWITQSPWLLLSPFKTVNSGCLCVVWVQCWSSRGKRRGQCWCVDPNGMQVSSNTKQKGNLAC